LKKMTAHEFPQITEYAIDAVTCGGLSRPRNVLVFWCSIRR
jgi:hypothetical protein